MVHPAIARLVERNCRAQQMLQALTRPSPADKPPPRPERVGGPPTGPSSDRPSR